MAASSSSLGSRDLALVVPDRQQALAAQEVVDRGCAAAAGGHGLDGRVEAHRGGVAAGEHAGAGRHHRVAVDADLAVLELQAVAALGEVVDERLADGEDDGVRRRARTREPSTATGWRRPESSGSPSSQRCSLTAATRRPRPPTAMRLHEELDLQALLAGLLDLAGVGRHLDLGAPVDQRHVRLLAGLLLQADGAARGVERHVAAADHDDLVADRGRAAEVELAQELDGADHAVEVVAGQRRLGALLQAGGQVDGLVALLEEAVDGEVRAGAPAQLQVDAERQDLVDLALDDLVRQAVVRDAGAQHAAGDRLRLEDGDLVAEVGQVAGAGEAGGAGADDGHAFLVDDRRRLNGHRRARRCRPRSA